MSPMSSYRLFINVIVGWHQETTYLVSAHRPYLTGSPMQAAIFIKWLSSCSGKKRNHGAQWS